MNTMLSKSSYMYDLSTQIKMRADSFKSIKCDRDFRETITATVELQLHVLVRFSFCKMTRLAMIFLNIMI